jgi:ABC-type Fe3+-siderophore transport system permease subunit
LHPLASPLRDILPLLVGSAFVIAFVSLVAKQSETQRIPSVAKKANDWLIIIASLIALIAAFLAIWYVGSSTAKNLVYVSYELLKIAFAILFIAFLFPFIINAITPLWRKYFYTQFEEVQSKDLEEARKAIKEFKRHWEAPYKIGK